MKQVVAWRASQREGKRGERKRSASSLEVLQRDYGGGKASKLEEELQRNIFVFLGSVKVYYVMGSRPS